MKKHLLSVFGLLAACTISATQYMHVNLPNGKEFDIKVEKTDKVSHEKIGDEVFIKVTRTDKSYSLYPMNEVEITFDEDIARMDSNVTNWDVKTISAEGCVLDTADIHTLRLEGVEEYYLKEKLRMAMYNYQNCISEYMSKLKEENGISFSENEIDAINSANQFATELFAEISQEDAFKDENVIFSPTSFQFALAMLANGADNDDTYAEIAKALGNETMPLDNLNEMYRKRMSSLQMTNPIKVKIGIANAAFLKNDIHFGKNFLQNIEEYYNAAANNVDFTEESTFAAMDKWASDNTDGMIPSLGLSPDPAVVLVLANALSFQSEWGSKFNKEYTKPGKFVTSKGEEKEVDKMNTTFSGYGHYAEGTNYQLITLPFFERYEMNVVLPKEGVAPESVLSEIDFHNIKYRYGRDTINHIDTIFCPEILLPKFNTNATIDLDEPMKKLGLKNTFNASFDNIAPGSYVDGVKQIAHLEIDEDGAKGAAVTIIPMATTAYFEYAYVDFDVNRPFIVTINNPGNHELLFVGLINDPTLK